MRHLVFLALAYAHDPTPLDALRFGINPGPARFDYGESSLRLAFKSCRVYRDYILEQHHGYTGYGRQDKTQPLVDDATWRYNVWYTLDDMCDTNLGVQCRKRAAEKLQGLLGPVDYYAGRLPTPWPE